MEASLATLELCGEKRRAIVVRLAPRAIKIPPVGFGFQLEKVLLLDELEPGGNGVFDLDVRLLFGGVYR